MSNLKTALKQEAADLLETMLAGTSPNTLPGIMKSLLPIFKAQLPNMINSAVDSMTDEQIIARLEEIEDRCFNIRNNQ